MSGISPPAAEEQRQQQIQQQKAHYMQVISFLRTQSICLYPADNKTAHNKTALLLSNAANPAATTPTPAPSTGGCSVCCRSPNAANGGSQKRTTSAC